MEGKTIRQGNRSPKMVCSVLKTAHQYSNKELMKLNISPSTSSCLGLPLHDHQSLVSPWSLFWYSFCCSFTVTFAFKAHNNIYPSHNVSSQNKCWWEIFSFGKSWSFGMLHFGEVSECLSLDAGCTDSPHFLLLSCKLMPLLHPPFLPGVFFPIKQDDHHHLVHPPHSSSKLLPKHTQATCCLVLNHSLDIGNIHTLPDVSYNTYCSVENTYHTECISAE